MSWRNGVKSKKHRAVDEALGVILAGDYVAEARTQGMSYPAIADMLYQDTDIRVTPRTLQGWESHEQWVREGRLPHAPVPAEHREDIREWQHRMVNGGDPKWSDWNESAPC